MPTIYCLPDNRAVEITDDEIILEAHLRANIGHAHACGGRAKCSTCRVWILEGGEHCIERTEEERALSEPLGFGPEVRLACQARVTGDVKLRRLVLDEIDLEITSQLSRERLGLCGENKNVAVLFSDIRGFTALSEALSAYDVVFVLSRYFYQIGAVIEENQGYIVDFYGDGVMALFGIEDDPDAPLRSVKAALEILDVVDRFKPYMESMYGRSFDAGIGVHYGPAVIGTVGSAKHQKLTAIGDTVNIANRVEAANKESGTRLLISDDLYEEVKDHVTVNDFLRVTLRGTSERRSLHEISGIDPGTVEALKKDESEGATKTKRHAGLVWTRMLSEDDLAPGERRVVQLDRFDVLLIRLEDSVHAVNNACPHLKLPLSESAVTEEGTIVCRWHESSFDLSTGEIMSWCPALAPDGTSEGMEYLGDISKNKNPMKPLPVRVDEGHIWVSIE